MKKINILIIVIICLFSLSCTKVIDFTGYWGLSFIDIKNTNGVSIIKYYVDNSCHYGSMYLSQSGKNIYTLTPCIYDHQTNRFEKVNGISSTVFYNETSKEITFELKGCYQNYTSGMLKLKDKKNNNILSGSFTLYSKYYDLNTSQTFGPDSLKGYWEFTREK